MSHPVQDPNCQPSVGVAVRATVVPSAKEALQVVPQSIPGGLLVTVPPATGTLLTVRV
jgi:hypothetical protein